jgi:hypothetical protein
MLRGNCITVFAGHQGFGESQNGFLQGSGRPLGGQSAGNHAAIRQRGRGMKILEIFTKLCTELNTLNKNLETFNKFLEVRDKSNEKLPDHTNNSSGKSWLNDCFERSAKLLERWNEEYKKKMECKGGAA